MDWIFPVVVFLVMSAIGLGTWLTSSHLEKKRRQRVIALANELGLELNWSLPPEDQQALAPFEAVQKGSNQQSSLSLVADDGVTRISLFDYSFVTGSGKNQQTHRWVLSLCRDERLRAPDMQLKPATFFSRIGSLIGFQDIDIPGAPEFSRVFVVQGKDPEGIRGFLNASRREAFLRQPKQTFGLRDRYLLIVREKKKLDAPNIKPLLGESLALIQTLSETSD